METFSLDYIIKLYDKDTLLEEIHLDSKFYSQIKGPYNLRNVYGAMLSYGPMFKDKELLLREKVLAKMFCDGNSSLKNSIPNKNYNKVNLTINSKISDFNKNLTVRCSNE